MPQRLIVVDPAGNAPTGIQVQLGKPIGNTARTTDLNFRPAAGDRGDAHQQQIAIALHHSQAVLQAQVLVAHADGIPVCIRAASTDACKVKIHEKRINHGWTGAALTPAGVVVSDLLNNQKLVRAVAIGRSDQHQLARI